MDLVVDYYAKFWKHFQLCKRAACSEQTRDRVTGEMKDTRDMYLDRIEVELKEWRDFEGRIRLLLPLELLEIHQEAIGKFNELNDAIYEYDGSNELADKKRAVFEELAEIKIQLEDGLRNYLRTESLIKYAD